MTRALLGRRRSLGVLLLAAVPVLVALILAVAGGLGSPASMAVDVFEGLNLALTIPLIALILGTGALGTQIDDGTIVYLLVKPVPRRTVVLRAMLVAAPATAALAVTSTLVRGSWCWARPSSTSRQGWRSGRSWRPSSTAPSSSPSRS